MAASIAHYFLPAFFSDGLRTSIHELADATFWIAALQIVLINILLSGDNAVVIAMACRGLPPRQRFWGVISGAALAVLLLIIFAAAIAPLATLPYARLIGGLALIYIAAKLVVPEAGDRNEVAATAHLWRAVRIIALADVIMSFDNIVAVTTVARGDFVLLVIGLAISVPIILAGAVLIMALLNRLPILVWAGAGLLGWIAGDAIATDPVVSGYLPAVLGGRFARQAETIAAGTGMVLAIAAGALWRRLRKSRPRAAAAGDEIA